MTEASAAKSKAKTAFEANLDVIGHMSSFAAAELRGLDSDAKLAVSEVDRATQEVRSSADRAAIVLALESARQHVQSIKARVKRTAETRPWTVVMMVTCVEAYLQDVLQLAAGQDPALMGRSEQSATTLMF